MVETIVEVHHSKIKKQNSNMYYITLQSNSSVLEDGFYKVKKIIKNKG